MRTLKNILPVVFLVIAFSFQSCEQDDLESPKESQGILPERFKVDIPNYKLNVKLSDDEIRKRIDELAEFKPRVQTGYLRRYVEKVTSASKGAVFSL